MSIVSMIKILLFLMK